VDAARGRRPVEEVAALLDQAGPGRLETSAPAPAAGLFLARVYYALEELEARPPDRGSLP
jgi:tRNA U38,U39,U40 pseudouridine synthase TruA